MVDTQYINDEMIIDYIKQYSTKGYLLSFSSLLALLKEKGYSRGHSQTRLVFLINKGIIRFISIKNFNSFSFPKTRRAGGNSLGYLLVENIIYNDIELLPDIAYIDFTAGVSIECNGWEILDPRII